MHCLSRPPSCALLPSSCTMSACILQALEVGSVRCPSCDAQQMMRGEVQRGVCGPPRGNMRYHASSAHQPFPGHSATSNALHFGLLMACMVVHLCLSYCSLGGVVVWCTRVLAAPATCMLLMRLRLPLPTWHPTTLPWACWLPCGCTSLGGRDGVW